MSKFSNTHEKDFLIGYLTFTSRLRSKVDFMFSQEMNNDFNIKFPDSQPKS